jgi:hypothetical protein
VSHLALSVPPLAIVLNEVLALKVPELIPGESWHLVLVSCVIGAGIGFAYGALPLLVMGAVPLSETAAANASNTLLRSVGTSVASAVSGVVLAQMSITLGGHALPSENAFKVVMAVGAGAALVALVLASFLPRQRQGTAVQDIY